MSVESDIQAELDRYPDLARFTLSRSTVVGLLAQLRYRQGDAERLRIWKWQHLDECSSCCTDACDEMHTYGPGCAAATDERGEKT